MNGNNNDRRDNTNNNNRPPRPHPGRRSPDVNNDPDNTPTNQDAPSNNNNNNNPSIIRPPLLGAADRPNLTVGLPPLQLDETTDPITSHTQDNNNNNNNNDGTMFDYDMFGINPPQRSNWAPKDDGLREVPPLYPKLDRRCTTYVTDVSASIVAARLSECLRKRSILAEFDDEAATATAYTSDGVRFSINLYRGGRGFPLKVGGPSFSPPPPPPPPSLSKTKSSITAKDHNVEVTFGGKALVSCATSMGSSSPDPMAVAAAAAALAASGGINTMGFNMNDFPAPDDDDGDDNNPHPMFPPSRPPYPDFSIHGVLVEVQRLLGCPMSFHRTCKTILYSARGESDGLEDCYKMGRKGRSVFASGISGVMNRDGVKVGTVDSLNLISLVGTDIFVGRDRSRLALCELEHYLSLLQKDRIDAQELGMQGIVSLTDDVTTSPEVVVRAALAVLGAPVASGEEYGSFGVVRGGKRNKNKKKQDGEDDENPWLLEVREWIVSLIVYSRIPGSGEAGDIVTVNENRCDVTEEVEVTAAAVASRHRRNRSSTGEDPTRTVVPTGFGGDGTDDAKHIGTLRRLALRCLVNSLSAITRHGPTNFLRSILQVHSEVFTSEEFISALTKDLGGSARPPSLGTASAHEAALASKCLNLLASNSENAKENAMNMSRHGGRSVTDALQIATRVGMSQHYVLEREAEAAGEGIMGGVTTTADV